MKKKIIIITGDPNSINSEIIYKSWSKLNYSVKKRIYFISNYNLLKRQFQKLNYRNKFIQVENIYQKTNSTEFKIINVPIKI